MDAHLQHVTRLAPSPTGALHLGNARTFVANWAIARQRGWRIVMRIEDLDGPRIKQAAIDDALRTLEWLGLDWDEGPHFQTGDPLPYASAMRELASRGLVYPCALTRTEIEAAASAPQEGSGESRFPRALRPGDISPRAFDPDEPVNWRFVVEPGAITFDDAFAGATSVDVSADIGDFVVWTKRRAPSYQLAVVVDDDRHGVTQIVRGDDLRTSAARQMLLRDALGMTRPITYTHLPLVIGEDGRRLAKRHGDTRIATYRDAGVTPTRVLGLLAEWCGMGERREITLGAFVEGCSLASILRGPITFSSEDDAWLRGSSA